LEIYPHCALGIAQLRAQVVMCISPNVNILGIFRHFLVREVFRNSHFVHTIAQFVVIVMALAD
jgi:hypothetical protein